MQAITITPLGTSAAAPTSSRNVSGTLLRMDGSGVLFDCGEGTQHRLQKSGWRASALELILISHLHGDHVYGLPGLLATLGMQGRTREVTVVGPIGIRSFLDGVVASTYLRLPYSLTILEAERGEVYRSAGLTIEVAPLRHRVPAIGFCLIESDHPGRFDLETARRLGIPEGELFGRLQRGESVTLQDERVITSSEVVGPTRRGRRIAYCCDTVPCDEAVELARGADLLIHEATYAEDLAAEAMERGHSTARGAAGVALRAGVRRLLLTHFSARYDDPALLVAEAQEIFPATAAARELEEIVIEARP